MDLHYILYQVPLNCHIVFYRVDFLIAMLQYVSITTRLGFVHPAIKDSKYTIQAIDNCKEILDSFSVFVSEMKEDQVTALLVSITFLQYLD